MFLRPQTPVEFTVKLNRQVKAPGYRVGENSLEGEECLSATGICFFVFDLYLSPHWVTSLCCCVKVAPEWVRWVPGAKHSFSSSTNHPGAIMGTLRWLWWQDLLSSFMLKVVFECFAWKTQAKCQSRSSIESISFLIFKLFQKYLYFSQEIFKWLAFKHF